MDFIEHIFGISPDGGDGSFEFFLFLIPISLLIVIGLMHRFRSPRQRKRPDRD